MNPCEPFLKCEPFLSICEPICIEDKNDEPIFRMTDKKVHNYEHFFHLWTFPKRFINYVLRHQLLPIDLWTQFYEPFHLLSLFHKGFTIMDLFMGWFFIVLLYMRPRFMNQFWYLWTDCYELMLSKYLALLKHCVLRQVPVYQQCLLQ